MVFQLSDDQGRHLRSRVRVPEGCREIFHSVELFNITHLRYRQDIQCPGQTLADLTFHMEAIPPGARLIVYVKKETLNTEEYLLTPNQNTWQYSPGMASQTVIDTITQYLSLGFIHILLGWDHLLFVLMLVLMVSSARDLLLTITAFTLGHSLTLALAATSLIRVPAPPTEALIALSIVFLAAEILRFSKTGHRTLTLRYPGLISIFFGLFHGLGFSTVLQTLSADSSPILWQLIGFNLGVELGQIVFVVGLLVLSNLLKQSLLPSFQQRLPAHKDIVSICRTIVTTVCGSIAAFALVERISGF
jgi:hydrogenase/urease accessory protein HupE